MIREELINRKIVGRILIITGSLLIVFVIAINLIDLLNSTKAINDFKNSQAHIVVEKLDNSGNVISRNVVPVIVSEKPNSDDEPDEQSDENVAMCLLRIPKIKLEEAVKEGSTKGVLSTALGHVENTAQPGEEGNCCIAGHRNYVFGKYFNRLDEITVGDVIEIETKGNLYKYDVISVEVVEPEEVRVLDYAEGMNLTLITCTPFMIGSHRLIVHAVMR